MGRNQNLSCDFKVLCILKVCDRLNRSRISVVDLGPRENAELVLKSIHVFVCVCVCVCMYVRMYVCMYVLMYMYVYRCPKGNVPDFGRMFVTLKYTDITQNTYIRS